MKDLKTLLEEFENCYSTQTDLSLSWVAGAPLFIKKSYETRNNEIKRIVRFYRPDLLIDMGAGAGDLAEMLSPETGCIITFDPTATNTTICNAKGFDTVRACVEFMPLKERVADVILLADVIEHLSQRKEALLQINRALKDDGVLIITTPNARAEKFWSILTLYRGRPKVLDCAMYKRDLIKLLEECHFSIVSYDLIDFIPRSKPVWYLTNLIPFCRYVLHAVERKKFLNYRQIVVAKKLGKGI